MALRNIKHYQRDEILRKKSRPVENINSKILILLDDMAETMYSANGVGLAAPQVGILKRIVIIDIGDGIHELINPEIIDEQGSQKDTEGCLSIPGISGTVIRPRIVKVRALNRKGETIELTGSGLLARALCHEIDHLDGILFIDKAIPGSLEEI